MSPMLLIHPTTTAYGGVVTNWIGDYSCRPGTTVQFLTKEGDGSKLPDLESLHAIFPDLAMEARVLLILRCWLQSQRPILLPRVRPFS